MPFRLSLRAGAAMAIALFITVFVAITPSPAQSPAPPATKPAAPTQIAPTPDAGQSGDVFGENTSLKAQTIVYVKGSGTWDKAFETITGAFKKLKIYVDKEGLKSDGPSMMIFTATDDTGFQFEAAVPVAEPPKNPPHGEIAAGKSPEGHALKFVHRGSYDGLDNTYEAITNFLDEKRLEVRDMFIEQYVTDPLSTSEDNLVINVFVPIK